MPTLTLLGSIQRDNSALAGSQVGVEVAGLANGGFAIGWTSQFGGAGAKTDAVVRSFDGNGTAVGTDLVVAAANGGNEKLTDIAAFSNGNFAVAWESSGSNLATYNFTNPLSAPVVRLFNPTTGAIGGDIVLDLTNTSVSSVAGVELFTTGVGIRAVFDIQKNGSSSVQAVGVSNTGVLSGATTLFGGGLADGSLVDAVLGDTASDVVFVTRDGSSSDFHLATSTGTTNQTIGTEGSLRAVDLERVENGVYAVGLLTGSPNAQTIRPTGESDILHGSGGNLADYVRTTASNISFGSPNDVSTTALGDGRLLTVSVNGQGVQHFLNFTVTNLASAAIETPFPNSSIFNAQLPLWSGPNTTVESLDSALLADGRVLVAWTQGNGVVGGEVYSAIFDARMSAVTVAGTALADVFVGTEFNDVLSGGLGNDRLTGGLGDDRLNGGLGSDTLDGGTGTDTVTYIDAAAAVRVDLVHSELNSGEAAGDVLVSIENLEGGALDDDIHGTAGNNTISGMAGKDTLDGRDGNDSLFGGAGDDVLIGSTGDDLLDGGIDNDSLIGGVGDDTIIGGAGLDSLYGGDGKDTLDGGDGVDWISGGAGDDEIHGGAGDDRLVGGEGNDHVDGGLGNDTIMGQVGDDILLGGDGNDIIRGGDGQDVIDGGAGDDFIMGDAGIDHIFGGSGFDTVSYILNPKSDTPDAAGHDGVFVHLTQIGDSFLDYDILANIEGVIGTNFNDAIVGDEFANRLSGADGNDDLYGNGGNDALFGGKGDDFLSGGAGADVLNGGLGTDRASYSDSAAGVTVNLLTPAANTGDALGDTFASVEVIEGSDFADTLAGNSQSNTFIGLDGNDVLIGNKGADILEGDGGADQFAYVGTQDGGGSGDVIKDFEFGLDLIRITGSAFGATTIANFASRFVASDAGVATTPSGTPTFIFDTGGAGAGQLIYDSNGSDPSGTILLATLTFTDPNVHAIGTADFLII